MTVETIPSATPIPSSPSKMEIDSEESTSFASHQNSPYRLPHPPPRRRRKRHRSSMDVDHDSDNNAEEEEKKQCDTSDQAASAATAEQIEEERREFQFNIANDTNLQTIIHETISASQSPLQSDGESPTRSPSRNIINGEETELTA